MNSLLKTVLFIVLVPTLAMGQDTPRPFVFKDVGDETGLWPNVANIRGHGVAWGDTEGTGWPDLFVATFHKADSGPGSFHRNRSGKFTLDPSPLFRTSGNGSGALFVDLNNTGRLDLYVSNCGGQIPSYLFRNDGKGTFTDISEQSGTSFPGFQGRGLAALDYDGDGKLDLILCEMYYETTVKTGPVLLRNKGNYQFENVSAAAGLPGQFAGLGVAVGDFNNDLWPDLFFTQGAGENRLYLNDGKGHFREAEHLREVFRWTNTSPTDNTAGACVGDVNGDGLLDIVVGHHFKRPWVNPVPIRLYLNQGSKNGNLDFKDVTQAAGLQPLPLKPPHVEIQDFDNDGLPDIYVSIYKFDATGRPYPVIYKNQGNKKGVPQFVDSTEGVNDFPTEDLKLIRGSAKFFARLAADNKITYSAAAPSADFDRDGKLDIFATEFLVSRRSLLLRNETPGGKWLDVSVVGSGEVNRMGIGTRINIYSAGKLGNPSARIGTREIAIGYGYCSGQEAIAHFGFPNDRNVDVEAILPHGKGTLVQRNVPVNQRIVLKR